MIDIFAKPLGALLNLVYKLVDGMGIDFGILSAYAMAVIITTILFKLIISYYFVERTAKVFKIR